MLEYQKWLRVFDYKNIDSFLKSEKGKGTLQDALVMVIVASLILQIPSSLISFLQFQYLLNYSMMESLGAVGIAFAIGLVLTPILFTASVYTQHMIASFLGGKGKFEDLAYLQGLITAGFTLVSIISLIPHALRLVPGAMFAYIAMSCILIPILLAMFVYQVFVTYKNILLVYGMDSGISMAAVVLNVVLWIIIALILIFVMIAILGPSFLESMGAQGSF